MCKSICVLLTLFIGLLTGNLAKEEMILIGHDLNELISQVMNEIQGVYKLPKTVYKIMFVCMYFFWEDKYPLFILVIYRQPLS